MFIVGVPETCFAFPTRAEAMNSSFLFCTSHTTSGIFCLLLAPLKGCKHMESVLRQETRVGEWVLVQDGMQKRSRGGAAEAWEWRPGQPPSRTWKAACDTNSCTHSPRPPVITLRSHWDHVGRGQAAGGWLRGIVGVLSLLSEGHLPRRRSGKEFACQRRKQRKAGSIPGLERCSGVGNGNPLQYYCLEDSMDRGAWRAAIHGVAKSGHIWVTVHTLT